MSSTDFVIENEPFIYSHDENDPVIREILISQKNSIVNTQEDLQRVERSINKGHKAFISLKKQNDGYILSGYLAFSLTGLGSEYRIDYIYGIDENIISNLLNRLTDFAITNRTSIITSGIKSEKITIFLDNGFVEETYNHIQQNYNSIPVIKRLY